MRSHRRLATTLLAIALVTAGLGFWLARDTPEKRFERGLLAAWRNCVHGTIRDQSDQATDATNAALHAIEQAGEVALPCLVKWIGPIPPQSGLRPHCYRLVEYWPFRTSTTFQRWLYNDDHNPQVRCAGSLWCFRIMGTNAARAIPELTAMEKGAQEPAVRWRATQVKSWAQGSIPQGPVLIAPTADRRPGTNASSRL